MKLIYDLGDVVQMKKDHPCRLSQHFTIVRMGADIKIKCMGCGAIIMMPRHEFERKIKKMIMRKEDE